MPALGRDKPGGFVAHLAVVKVDIGTEQVGDRGDDTRFGKLIEPVIVGQRLVHYAFDVLGVKGVGLVALGAIHKGVAHIFGAAVGMGD